MLLVDEYFRKFVLWLVSLPFFSIVDHSLVRGDDIETLISAAPENYKTNRVLSMI